MSAKSEAASPLVGNRGCADYWLPGGLTTAGIEYELATNDRADIVLWDRFGRIVGVEIEVLIADGDSVGLLQAIKYRRMLELVTRRNPGDSRSVLVAYGISDAMRELAERYGIECYIISAAEVNGSATP